MHVALLPVGIGRYCRRHGQLVLLTVSAQQPPPQYPCTGRDSPTGTSSQRVLVDLLAQVGDFVPIVLLQLEMVHRGVQPIDSHQSASQSTIELRGSSHTGVAAQTTGGQYCSRQIGWTARWPRSRGGTTTPVLPRCRSGDESARTWPRNPSQSPITTQRYQEIRDRIYLQQLPIVAHNQPVKLGGPGVTLIQCCNPPEIPIPQDPSYCEWIEDF